MSFLSILKKIPNFKKKKKTWWSFFGKVAGLQHCNLLKWYLKINAFLEISDIICSHQRCSVKPVTLLKKSLCHRCFPVHSAKYLRAPFFTVHLRRNASNMISLLYWITIIWNIWWFFLIWLTYSQLSYKKWKDISSSLQFLSPWLSHILCVYLTFIAEYSNILYSYIGAKIDHSFNDASMQSTTHTQRRQSSLRSNLKLNQRSNLRLNQSLNLRSNHRSNHRSNLRSNQRSNLSDYHTS